VLQGRIAAHPIRESLHYELQDLAILLGNFGESLP
jgi:hypothetical protein